MCICVYVCYICYMCECIHICLAKKFIYFLFIHLFLISWRRVVIDWDIFGFEIVTIALADFSASIDCIFCVGTYAWRYASSGMDRMFPFEWAQPISRLFRELSFDSPYAFTCISIASWILTKQLSHPAHVITCDDGKPWRKSKTSILFFGITYFDLIGNSSVTSWRPQTTRISLKFSPFSIKPCLHEMHFVWKSVEMQMWNFVYTPHDLTLAD